VPVDHCPSEMRDLSGARSSAAACANLLANRIAGWTPFAALSALTGAFCLGFRLRMWPMYWPWSFRVARRARESFSLRPVRS
jgi:hypothetical protein